MGQETKVIDVIIRGRDEASAQVRKLDGATKTADKSTKTLAQDMTKVATASTQAGKRGAQSFSNFNKTLQKTKKAVAGIGDHLSKVGPAMTMMGAAMAAPFAIGIAKAGSFQKEMSNVKAVTNATGETFNQLTGIAREMGATTQFTAKQSGEALSFLGMAGLSAQDSMTALPDTLNLAAAGSLGLGEAADIATNVLAGMRMPVDELNKVVDALAVGATSSNTDVRMLGEGMKVVGPAAAASKESLQNMVSVLGALANNGIKGAEGGTAVRNMLIRLQNPSAEAARALDALNIKVFEADGTFRGVIPIMDELGKAQMTTSQAAEIFGMRTAVAALAAANATTDIQKLSGALDDMDGKAKKMADIKLDNLAGAMKRLYSAFESLMITIGNKFVPIITSLAGYLTTLIGWFDALQQALGPVATLIDGLVFAFGGLLAALGTMAMTWKFVIEPLIAFKAALAEMQIVQTFAGTGAAVATETGVMTGGLTTATTATLSLETAMATLAPMLGTMALAFAAFWGVSKIVELIGVMKEYITVANEQERISASYAAAAGQFEEFAKIQVRSNEAIKNATVEVNQAYAVSLEGALQYWEKIAQSEAAAGGVTDTTQDKINSLIDAMGNLHQTDPAVVFESMGDAAATANPKIEEFSQSIEVLDGMIAGADAAGKEMTAGLKSAFAQLKLEFEKGAITEDQYRQKRLEKEKTHWDDLLTLRKIKLDAMTLAGDTNSAAYAKAMDDVVIAETKAIVAGKKLAESVDKIGNALADIPDKEKTAELSFQSLVSTLETQLAKGKITEDKYKKERLRLEVEHWKKMVEIRRTALDLMAEKYGASSDEWLTENAKLQKAEQELANVLKDKVVPALDDTGDAAQDAGDTGKDAANMTEEAWRTFASQLGISVSDLKNAIHDVQNEMQDAEDAMNRWREQTKRKSFTMSVSARVEVFKDKTDAEIRKEIQRLRGVYNSMSEWVSPEQKVNARETIIDLEQYMRDRRDKIAQDKKDAAAAEVEAQKRIDERKAQERKRQVEEEDRLQQKMKDDRARAQEKEDRAREKQKEDRERAAAKKKARREKDAADRLAGVKARQAEKAAAVAEAAAKKKRDFENRQKTTGQDGDPFKSALSQRSADLIDTAMKSGKQSIDIKASVSGFNDIARLESTLESVDGLTVKFVNSMKKLGEVTSAVAAKMTQSFTQVGDSLAKMAQRLEQVARQQQEMGSRAGSQNKQGKQDPNSIPGGVDFPGREGTPGLNFKTGGLTAAQKRENENKNKVALRGLLTGKMSESQKRADHFRDKEATLQKQLGWENLDPQVKKRLQQDIDTYKQAAEKSEKEVADWRERALAVANGGVAGAKAQSDSKIKEVSQQLAIAKGKEGLYIRQLNNPTSKMTKEERVTKENQWQAMRKKVADLTRQLEDLKKKETLYMSLGGPVPGYGTGDTVDAKLTPGEIVLPVPVIRSGRINEFLDSLPVNIPMARPQAMPFKFAGGGMAPETASERVEITFNIGGDRMAGLFQKDQAQALIETLQGASMVAT